MNVLELDDVTVGYPRRILVRNMTGGLRRGSWIHLHGKNGVGKTTFLEVLASFLQPMRGELRWKGQVVRDHLHEYRQNIRYFGHDRALFQSLSVRDNLNLYGGVFGFSPSFSSPILADISLDQPVNKLSQGQRQKLQLLTVLDAPRLILLLDEPRASLDAQMTEWVMNDLVQLRARGHVLVSVSPEPLEVADEQWLLQDQHLEIRA